MTKEQAIALAATEWYKDLSAKDIVKFQLFESKLCMPFSKFQEAVEIVLNRPVFTHEFAYPEILKKEFLGEAEPPTMQEILDLIPEEKRLIINL